MDIKQVKKVIRKVEKYLKRIKRLKAKRSRLTSSKWLRLILGRVEVRFRIRAINYKIERIENQIRILINDIR